VEAEEMLLQILETGVPAVAFLLMVAVGLDVTRTDLRRVTANRRTLAIATLGQAVILPAAALLLSRTLPSSSRVADYVLLIAACPGGGMSNVYVYLARANTTLSVTMTALSCLLAIATMPAIVAAYQAWLGRAVEFALPLPTLVAQLLVMAVIPVTVGAWIRDRYPKFERRHGGHLRAISAAAVVGIVAVGMVQSADAFNTELVAGGAAAAGLVVTGMTAGWGVGAALRLSAVDSFTMLVEFAVRNLAIAMVIEVSLLHHSDFVPFGALALVAQAALLGLAVQFRRRAAQSR
jgi:BASS family bile acid:Na+ symporter